MKKLLLFILFFSFVLPAQIYAGGKDLFEKKLPFKKATIHYTLSGMEKGTEILAIRKKGEESAKVHSTSTSMMGMVIKNESLEITDSDWVYSYDLTKQTGTKMTNPQKFMMEEYNKLSRADKKKAEKNAEKFGTSMAAGFSGEVVENATKILGYSCDKTIVMGSEVYMIHGTDILLKSESNIMGMSIKSEATKIEKGKADSKYFKHPEGIEAVFDEKADAMSRSMAKQIIAMLVDPESAQASSNQRQQQIPKQDVTEEEQQQIQEAMDALKGIFGGGN